MLAQAQQDGATLVVGPLLKENVDDVIKSNTPLNVLALNQPEKVESRANLCYFALSPEDEARDAARHIHQQGKQTPLLLVPRGALGDRVVSAFADEWLKLGGASVLQQRFGSTAELRAAILNLDTPEPVVVKRRYEETSLETLAVKAAADLGVLLLDGLADGIWIDAPGFAEEQVREIELMILQAARVRFSHTEYIALSLIHI